MGNEKAEELIRKYLAGTATPEEEALLESWYIEAAHGQPDVTGEPGYPKIGAEILDKLRAEQEGLTKPGQPGVKSPIRLWPRIAAAAAVLIVLVVGGLFVFRKGPTARIAQDQTPKNDILPAGTRATLTMLDGRTMALDSAGGDNLARQADAILSVRDGQLIYTANEPDRAGSPAGMAYNTLTTRPGEHYSLRMPDGTNVWLNAASSITYPVVFIGNERKVIVTGEAYFEIVHNAKRPFKIGVSNELVEDIGTHLNINAYDDESTIKTTLVEGSIKVTKGSASAILAPGQQATIRPGDSSFQLEQADADEAIAWKNGFFYFNRADIQTVMRQLARWYNVQVVYKGEISKKTFKGKLYRNINASEALQILSYFGAHFQIDGRTITVSS
jgi:transmembrane sensor